MGNTVAALLEFFQPYPGDELVPWSDDRRDSKRFRVLRPTDEFYTIEDSYMDAVMVLPLEWLRIPSFHLMEWYARERAKSLDITYREVLPIHKFPIEELLADAVSQYFQDVSRHLPMFELVGIGRILREPEDLDGSDDYVVSIPLEPQGLHAEISEACLLNPKLDLVSWVLKRRLKTLLHENNSRNGWRGTRQTNYFGSLFDDQIFVGLRNLAMAWRASSFSTAEEFKFPQIVSRDCLVQRQRLGFQTVLWHVHWS
jgi:hypothetical protein